MSRSYKKTPYSGDKKNKCLKNQANRRIRRYQGEISNGRKYRRFLDSWEICDYYDITSFEKYWQICLKHHNWWTSFRGIKEDPPTREEVYREWYKYYKRK